jgi:hypothetical protein
MAALFVLAGFAAPSVSATITLLHFSAHHAAEAHDEHHERAADLSALWHGHRHEATTPDHGHPLLLAGMHPATDQVDQIAAGPWDPATLTLAAGPRVWRSCPPGLGGLGPPPPPCRLSILRI